ncbi:MAG: DNA-directed RNA polymerase subunit omega [Calditrichaeota bacterium]|nr:MAG: DNA-directed RNA polymerase subunit omega [Calditrichota bacterium]
MNETLPIEKLLEHSGSIYEAVVIIARRARQINERQRQLIEKEVALNNAGSNNNDDEDDFVERDYVDSQYLKLPKPTTIALQEMLEGKLSFEYIDDSE